MVGGVARCVYVRFDRRDQRMEPLAHLRLFGLESVELRPQFRQRLSYRLVGHILRERSMKRFPGGFSASSAFTQISSALFT